MIAMRGYTASFSLVVLILVIVPTAGAEDLIVPPDISIEAQLSDTRFFLAEPFQLTVQVSWSGEHGDIQVDPPAKVPLEGLDLLSTSSSNRTILDGDRRLVVREYRYRLRPVREGEATIGSLSVAVRHRPAAGTSASDADAVSTPLTTLSTSPLAITIQAPPPSLRIPWHTLASAVGVLLFSGAFIAFLRHKRRTERPRDTVSALSPRETLAATVESIESLLFAGEIKQYYAAFEKAFFVFVRDMSGVSADGRDGDAAAIAAILSRPDVLSEEDVATVNHWVEVNGLVKFGGHQPSEEDVRRQIRALMRIAANLEKKSTTLGERTGA